jgi:hypothetical protein
VRCRSVEVDAESAAVAAKPAEGVVPFEMFCSHPRENTPTLKRREHPHPGAQKAAHQDGAPGGTGDAILAGGRTASPFLIKIEKPRCARGFFFFYSISSVYHAQRINRPNIFEGIRV